MQPVSNLFNSILGTTPHWFETKVKINNVDYGKDKLKEVQINSGLFSDSKPLIGCASSAEISISMTLPSVTIPRKAQIIPYYRVCDNSRQSEWVQRGVFYIDTREIENAVNGDNILHIDGYDAMLQAEQVYSGTGFPKTAYNTVTEIASNLNWNVNTDTLNRLSSTTYQVNAPTSYTYREVLRSIAGMYCGNFIFDYEGKLKLVYLNEMPAETYVLVTESGFRITFGQGTNERGILIV